MVVIDGKHKIHFGAKGYTDFLISGDEQKKQMYIERHRKELPFWENPKTAAFWSRFLLWEEKNIFDAISEIEKKINTKITYSTPKIK